MKTLKQKQTAHYDTRILFDYYRNKMPTLNTQDPKKKDRYEKNLAKQEIANNNYAKACIELERYLRNLECRVDVVLE